MVLLCFFILFFSVNSDKKSNIIEKIAALDFANEARGSGDGKGISTQAGSPQGAPALSTLSEIAQRFEVEVTQERNQLIIKLPDNIYAKGRVELDPDVRDRLTELLKKLSPYATSVDITFVGHTDTDPIQKRKSWYIQDNFDLSSMRATKALQLAVNLGFKEEHLYAQGSSGNIRASRTLSLILKNSKSN